MLNYLYEKKTCMRNKKKWNLKKNSHFFTSTIMYLLTYCTLPSDTLYIQTLFQSLYDAFALSINCDFYYYYHVYLHYFSLVYLIPLKIFPHGAGLTYLLVHTQDSQIQIIFFKTDKQEKCPHPFARKDITKTSRELFTAQSANRTFRFWVPGALLFPTRPEIHKGEEVLLSSAWWPETQAMDYGVQTGQNRKKTSQGFDSHKGEANKLVIYLSFALKVT